MAQNTITVETHDEQEAYWEGLAKSMLTPAMSHGSLGIFGDFEYFSVDDLVYGASIHNPVGVTGTRQGARFECKLNQWERMRARLESYGYTRNDALAVALKGGF